jgi:hypothetical protein
MSPVQSVTYVPVRTVRGWCVERQMRRKLSLTLPLSLYKGNYILDALFARCKLAA